MKKGNKNLSCNESNDYLPPGRTIGFGSVTGGLTVPTVIPLHLYNLFNCLLSIALKPLFWPSCLLVLPFAEIVTRPFLLKALFP